MRFNIQNFQKLIIFCSLGFGYIPLNAEETWIEINKGKIPPSIITSSKYEGYGYVNYLDIKSFVKKKGVTYFNWNTRLTKPNGTLVDTNFEISKKGGRINCKDKTVYLSSKNGNSFRKINEEIGAIPFALWSEIYPIVCEKNNPKWKFW